MRDAEANGLAKHDVWQNEIVIRIGRQASKRAGITIRQTAEGEVWRRGTHDR